MTPNERAYFDRHGWPPEVSDHERAWRADPIHLTPWELRALVLKEEKVRIWESGRRRFTGTRRNHG